ncbi:MAG: ribonuclease P protein component 1 [Candidatus Aenigmarchaeota archaeon]|nr:ribonuclease P protein component 1 [Candidatus Aenigmarchaeota archaeon]
MRNASNILRHELIGLKCRVVGAKNKGQVGIEGKIVDETMKTIMIDGRKVPKKCSVFRVKIGAKNVDIDGNYLVARPEDRIKKKIKKW